MKYAMTILAAGLVAGCATADEPETDTCGAGDVQHLVGELHPEVAGQFPGTARVLTHDSMATTDHRIERMNLSLDPEGRILRIWCG